MTDVLSRPMLRVSPSEPVDRRPLALSCVIALVWTAAVGLVGCITVAVAVWFSGGAGSFGSAVRTGAFAWLTGNGSGLVVGSGTGAVSLTAIPLGLTVLWGLLLYRGGRWAGAHAQAASWRDVAAGGTTLVLGYAGLGAAVALLSATESAHVDVVRAAVGCGLVALLLGGAGILRGTGPGVEVWGVLPEPARAVVLGALAAVAMLVAAGALTLTVSLLVHFDEVVTLAEGAGAGTLGGLVLALFCAALVPNAALCAGAFVAGPGFALGTGTVVAPGDVQLGAMPGFPLLGALPQGDGSAWWLSVLVVVPVFAGALAGLVATRLYPVYRPDLAAAYGAGSGLLGGMAFGLLTGLAGGSVGPGRMQDVGPDMWPTVLVCALAGLLGGAVTAAAMRWVGQARGSD